MDRAMAMRDMEYDENAIMDDDRDAEPPVTGTPQRLLLGRSPLSKTRSMSDGGTPSKLSPSPHITERNTSKDDSHIGSAGAAAAVAPPVTPHRSEFPLRGLSLQMPANSPSSSSSATFTKPAPLSPKLDHSQIYASPTNILPRRSRGLDFSRAATSLHHSTLAESSPDSSPTIGGRGMNIPGRRSNDYGQAEQTTNSLWSMMGNHERMTVSSSLGSANHPLGSDSSSSSDDDDIMDEDMDEPYIGTPQANKTSAPIGTQSPAPWMGSPAMNSLMSFQQRQRQRKLPKKKHKPPLGLGFSPATVAGLSKSPPSNSSKDASAHNRRESISWQANQLHISGEEERGDIDHLLTTPSRDGQRPTIMKRVVTRRANLLPKTKNFARIRAALFEEGAPVEVETRREAEVVRQVRESDMDLEPPRQPTAPATQHSSPNLGTQETSLDDIPESMITDSALSLSGSFKQQALKNSKGSKFWDTFSEASSAGTRTTPPPPNGLPRGSSSGMSEDISMDSPSLGPTAGFAMAASSGESQKGDTPLLTQGPQPAPSAAEITRRINSKRRREDDFDPVSFKRRAVSPGMSVHNSPIMQSPMQRDVQPWGSRPGSNSGDRGGDRGGGERGGSGAPSESGSLGGTPGSNPNGNGRVNGTKGRVGFQGMVDTSDGLMRMSIE
ncbi:hypothetical protein CkaCkLH20_06157 [Colletotrichum karsti]|uniref:Uncharacterized protein n=1 Tax=Colletotrichum karsti TaxID=1095194 RepID=A0A9P6I4S6_9PEZI|nr:uncharacterized protein CkaCkLH20_06157 [Colletotrichum karsti]KAF9876214.1 hypothetical protein CkaCkLH20_06157 [Colletotrichum karsti]